MRAYRHLCLLLCGLLACSLLFAQAQTPHQEPDAPKPSVPVQTLLDEGNKAFQQRQWDEALKILDRALAAAQQAKDPVGEARSYRGRALVLAQQQNGVEAVVAWKAATSAWERAGDGPGRVEALGKAGALLLATNHQEAKILLGEALALGTGETKRPLAAAAALLSVGTACSDRGELASADAYYQRSLAIQEKLAPGSLAVAASLNNLGNVAHDRGDLGAADAYYQRSLAIKERLAPGSLQVADSLNELGNVAHARGDLGAAEDYYKRSLAIREKLAPGSLDVAASLLGLGLVAHARGDLVVAEDYHKRSLAIQESVAPGSLDVATSLNNLGLVAARRGDLATAEKQAGQAWKLVRKHALTLSGEEAQQAFGESKQAFAADLLGYQIARKHTQAALLTLEQARAQSLHSPARPTPPALRCFWQGVGRLSGSQPSPRHSSPAART